MEQNKVPVLFVVSCLLTLSLLNGCARQSTQAESTDKQLEISTHDEIGSVQPSEFSPSNIRLFGATSEGESIRFFFLLEDNQGTNTLGEGTVRLVVSDDMNESLYDQEFKVNPSEFVDYQFQMTGQPVGKAFEWRVRKSDIKKGVSFIGLGTAVLTFETLDGKTLKATPQPVEIPAYSDEELSQMAEDDYDKTAVTIGQKLTKSSFEINVTKAGFYSTIEMGQKEKYFRIDMEIKNVARSSQYFSPSKMALIDSQGNQYDISYRSTLKGFSTMYPDVVKKGFILFENVPADMTSAKLVFELGMDIHYQPNLLEYTMKLK
ncbi:MAG: DUF4352 domain-containing protein [Candidatus Woesearchaeota archaeon]